MLMPEFTLQFYFVYIETLLNCIKMSFSHIMNFNTSIIPIVVKLSGLIICFNLSV